MTCAANFYDSGGVGDYSNDENNTVTYCPDSPDKCIVVTFNVFDVECTNPGCTVCKDKLFIYDGSTVMDPLLYSGCSTGALPASVTSTMNGCITFKFTSNGTVVRPFDNTRLTERKKGESKFIGIVKLTNICNSLVYPHVLRFREVNVFEVFLNEIRILNIGVPCQNPIHFHRT